MQLNQEGKKNSTNIQGNKVEVSVGLSYSDVKQLSLDIYKNNFIELSQRAADIAFSRVEELTNDLIEKLRKDTAVNIQKIDDPDIQHAIFTAQKGYARSGEDEMKKTLNNILIERIKLNGQPLLQIVLNEAIEVVPKLTRQQLDILSFVFITSQTKNPNVRNIEDFRTYIKIFYLPFLSSLSAKHSVYQHLEYTGCCGKQRVGSIYFCEMLHNQYRHVFQKGFTLEKFEAAAGGNQFISSLLVKNSFNPELYSLNITSIAELKEIVITKLSMSETNFQDLKGLYSLNLLGIPKSEDFLLDKIPEIEPFINIWRNSHLPSMYQTSVGNAIGITNIKSKIDISFNLSSWIKE